MPIASYWEAIPPHVQTSVFGDKNGMRGDEKQMFTKVRKEAMKTIALAAEFNSLTLARAPCKELRQMVRRHFPIRDVICSTVKYVWTLIEARNKGQHILYLGTPASKVDDLAMDGTKLTPPLAAWRIQIVTDYLLDELFPKDSENKNAEPMKALFTAYTRDVSPVIVAIFTSAVPKEKDSGDKCFFARCNIAKMMGKSASFCNSSFQDTLSALKIEPARILAKFDDILVRAANMQRYVRDCNSLMSSGYRTGLRDAMSRPANDEARSYLQSNMNATNRYMLVPFPLINLITS